MENEFSETVLREDGVDREVQKLIREMEEQERTQRAVIDVLVMLGDDATLAHDV
jgi:hypothetical protein